jgi:hypothetical protein
MKNANSRSGLKAIAIIFILVFQLFSLSAQENHSDSLDSKQLDEIKNLVYQDRLSAQRWWYTWIAGYSAATIGQGIVYFYAEEKTTRQDMALGSVSAILGALGLLITPIVPPNSSIENPMLTENSSGGEIKTMENYEEILKEIARRETAGKSWKMHALTGSVNLGCGLVTWLGFNRTVQDGLVIFVLNTAVTEAQIWSQPIRAKRDYQNYCKKYYSTQGEVTLKPQLEWAFNVYPGGLSFELNF